MSARLVLAADPDSDQTALAVAELNEHRRWVFAAAVGGGSSSRPVEWSTITGAVALLERLGKQHGVRPGEIVVVFETQSAGSRWSVDVEALRRVRYHWEAACEVRGVAYVEVDPGTWEQHFAGDEPRGKGAGALKSACQRRAKKLAGKRLKNEDQRDAFGMLSWYVETQLSEPLIIDG